MSASTDIFITDCLRSWDKFGRSNFLTQCKKVSVEASMDNLHELAVRILAGDGKIEQFTAVVNELNKVTEDETFESKLGDLLWLLDSTVAQADENQQKDRFYRLVSSCQGIVSEPVLKERLSEDTLESLHLIPSKQQFQTRYVKTKTRLFYKQQKFNLLREENEGFAKLITDLAQFSGRPEDAIQQIRSLIGYFDLDPNRVLDLILDVCEMRPDAEELFVSLIQLYNPDQTDLAHILGHKFHFSQGGAEGETPLSLYRMTALFVHHNMAQLDSIYPHLYPSDGVMKELHSKDLTEAKGRKPVTVSSDPDKKETTEGGTDTPELEDVDQHYSANQKIGLCKALLEMGDWEKARELLDHFPGNFATSYQPLALCICSLLHHIIDPLYKRVCSLPKVVQRHRKKVHGKFKVEQATDFMELVKRAFPIASYLGPNVSYDIILMVKLCRIGQAYFEQRDRQAGKSIEPIYQGFFNLLDEVLLPSLTLVESNCSLAEEIWEIIRHMPYDHRYRLYGQWRHMSCQTLPKLIRQKNECIARTRYVMKRLSKENVKPLGRQLGKLCHSNPGVVFEQVLTTIQMYDNLIGPVVDAFKYLGSLSYDVLTYFIIEALAAPDKVKFEDMQLSMWLQGLSNFTGLLCKKYQFDLSGLLQYILNQLKDGKSSDLLILREVLHKMSGIEISEEMTDDQLEALTGGELLRQEAGYFSQVRNTRRNSSRLKEALMTHELALPFVFMMAQQRDLIMFSEDPDRHIKLTGKLYDQCQDTLVQFGTFLSLSLSTDEFVKQCPSIDVLMGQYHVPADAAFFLIRSIISHKITNLFDERKKLKDTNKEDNDRDSNMSPSQLAYIDACGEVIGSITEAVRPLYPARVWEELSISFFVTFWSLQSSDIVVPKTAYLRQVAHLKHQIIQIESDPDAMTSKKKEKDRLQSLADRLSEEEKRRGEHVNRVMARLQVEKEAWFQTRTSTKTDTITQLLELCVFPRVCFTVDDALYAARFIHTLHKLKTPNFSTLICFDRIFNDCTLPVTSCTENEAHRYGRFLCAILELIMKWHGNKDVYDAECNQYPGFVTVFRKGTDANTKADHLQYENYRHVVHKWHYRITKASVSCLESGTYVQIRNALLVLTRIQVHYPRILQFGSAVERRVEKLVEEEKDKRKDLHVLAQSYLGHLRIRRPSWLPEKDFHLKEDKTRTTTVNNGTAEKRETGSRSRTGDTTSTGQTTSRTIIHSSRVMSKEQRTSSTTANTRDERSSKHEEGKTERVSLHQSSSRAVSTTKADRGEATASRASSKPVDPSPSGSRGSGEAVGTRRPAEERPAAVHEEKRRKVEAPPGVSPVKASKSALDSHHHLHRRSTERSPSDKSSGHTRAKSAEREERRSVRKRSVPLEGEKRSPAIERAAKLKKAESSPQVRSKADSSEPRHSRSDRERRSVEAPTTRTSSGSTGKTARGRSTKVLRHEKK